MALKSPRQKLQPDLPPKAPKRSRHVRNPFVMVMNFFFSVIVLTVIVGGIVFYWGTQEYKKPGPLQSQTTVVVPRGAGMADIADSLQRNGVIDSTLLFQASVRLQKKAGDLKAGEYLFGKGVTMEEVVAKLEDGKSVVYKVTLPEGLTSLQIVERLRQDEILVGDIENIPPEGSLLPNTYTFGRGTNRQQIIDQMKAAQEAALERIWASRIDDLPLRNKNEMVTLASIVEKETGKADERSRVAGVFINRLNRGMKLQSDPTIIYGLFGGAGKPPDRPIYKSDISSRTAYNTYVIEALPPGPIANPGLAAMEAVANPSTTKDLFFVADGTGGHSFAETLEEHNQNVQRWRQIERERKAAKKKREAQDAASSDTSN